MCSTQYDSLAIQCLLILFIVKGGFFSWASGPRNPITIIYYCGQGNVNMINGLCVVTSRSQFEWDLKVKLLPI